MIANDSALKPSLLSQAGFSDVVILRDLLQSIRGSITPAAVAAALRSARDHPGFMSHSFTCGGTLVSLLPALCNADAQISVVDGGRLRPVGTWVDTAPIAKLVG